PLLEFSLTELFDDRASDQITLEAYGKSSGVLAALGRRAEGTYTSLEPAGQDASRETFLRLVSVSDSGRATRRRARRTELERLGFSDVTLNTVLDAFADHRLVTFDRDPITRGPTVEVAHEAILSEWPRLADWIEDRREDLLLRSRLAVAVADWEAADRSETYLLTGGRLEQHESWTTDTKLTLTSAEQEFLSSSRHTENERRAKRRRNRRLVMSGFGVAAVIALVLAITALFARDDARDKATLAAANEQIAKDNATLAAANEQTAKDNAALAEEKTVEAEDSAATAAAERDSARAAQLGAAALEQISTDPERSLLLSIESLRTAPTTSGLAAVHAALFEHYTTWVKRYGLDGDVEVALAIHPDGQYVIAGILVDALDTGRFALYDIVNQPDEPIWYADVSDGNQLDFGIFVAWFGDREVMVAFNHYTATGSAIEDNGSVMVLDLATGEITKTRTFGECVSGVLPTIRALGRLSPIAVVLAEPDPDSGNCSPTAPDRGVRYFPGGIESDEFVDLILPAPFPFWALPITATADGKLLAFGNSNAMYVFDAVTGEVVNEFEGERITISSDGERILINQGSYTQLVDRETGNVLKTFPGEFFWSSWRFSTDDTRLIAGSFDDATHIFDLETGAEIYELRGEHYNPVISDTADDPDTLLITSFDTSRVLNLSNRTEVDPPISGLPRLIDSNGHNGHHASLSLAGGSVYVPFGGDTGPGYRVYDHSNGTVVREVTDVWLVAEMSPDGRYIAEVPRLDPEAVTPNGEEAPLYGQLRLVDTITGDVVRVFESTCPFYETQNWPNPIVRHESCGNDLLPMPLSDAEFSANGSRLGVDTHTGTPSVFDVATGSIIWSTDPDRDSFFTAGVIALSPDGSSFLYRSSSEPHWTLTTVNVDTGEEISSADHLSASYEIVFSDDGSRVYVGNWSGIIYVYDGKSHQLVDTLTRAQGGGILDVAPNGNLVATATFDKAVRIQTLDTHELALEVTLDVKAENIEWLNENHLMVILQDGSVLVFTVDSDELQQIVRSRLTRGFTEEECASFSIDPCPTLEEIRNG
ncbi:MAG: WD40 repeat domain-containing protein, partial [Actinomycetota bacterium]